MYFEGSELDGRRGNGGSGCGSSAVPFDRWLAVRKDPATGVEVATFSSTRYTPYSASSQ